MTATAVAGSTGHIARSRARYRHDVKRTSTTRTGVISPPRLIVATSPSSSAKTVRSESRGQFGGNTATASTSVITRNAAVAFV